MKSNSISLFVSRTVGTATTERPRNAAVTADEADTKKAGDIISTRVRTPKNKGQRGHVRYNSHNNYT